MKTIETQHNEKIITPGFCCIAIANFLMFLSFYALMPVLPYYLREMAHAPDSLVGVVLACYSVACIIVRPFSGWMLDSFKRRPIYLIAYAAFMLVFLGYAWTASVLMIMLFRLLHGLSFGIGTVAGTTIVSYLVPKKRLGEGLGIYGLANNMSMAVGPMLGLWLHTFVDYQWLFVILSALVLLGLLFATAVPVHETAVKERRRISFTSLMLVPALVPALALLFAAVPYGMTTTYITLLADEYGLRAGAGVFYTTMAIGLGCSRVMGGRWIDRGDITVIIMLSFSLVFCAYTLLTLVHGIVAFLITALLIGLSFGVVHPAFNTLFVRMATPQMRGAATSTYLTAFDMGIGAGILLGGFIASATGTYHASFVAGAISVAIAVATFYIWKKLRL